MTKDSSPIGSARFVLALDQGTTSSRAILFDHAGTPVASAQQEFRQHFPQPGWVEHDASEIWATQRAVMTEAMHRAGARPQDVAAIGITNQRETTVLWDRATGRPIANAIVWQDRRTAALCDRLKAEGKAALIQQKTGLVLDAYFSGTKLKWLLDNVPGARERAAKGELAFGTIDAWLIWNLTGGKTHATDPSNASRTLLFNIHNNAWDDELLQLLDIPRSVLPEVRPSSGAFGDAVLDGAAIPIAGNAGDQQAALFGQACHSPGMAKNTYGTGCFLLLNTGAEAVTSNNNLLTTTAWQLAGAKPQYALEGSVFIGGAVVQWLRDGLRAIKTAADVEALAAEVPDSGGVYLVPAFAGLGAPHWDQYARGAMFGLTRGSGITHIARAALESIAFQSAEVLAAMEKDAGIKLTELRVDGGATANNLLMQIQADLLGVPVVRPKVLETTALGAAYLAGLAVGFWHDAGDIKANWQVDRVFEPTLSRDRAAEMMAGWAKAVERSKGWAH
ncbi:MAG TPA: glycerol kinase GlpK [Casimicrobium huifangae]|nr:glycerol kinase GlpK [Casimicrobium huifangae]HQA32925.1 glycerol kinase GlpK [Casimicrobium huifangae]